LSYSAVEVDELGKKYKSYPDTNVYFSCSDAESALATTAEKKKLSVEDYIRRRIDEYNAGVTERREGKGGQGGGARGKTTYCGDGEMENIIKARMCGSYNSSTFNNLSLTQLGSPGQCFQYGKNNSMFPQFTR
jgi:hypothetical protein